MLIGIYVANIKIGSSPFVLVRNLDENIGLPWTQMENYLQIVPQFMDGRVKSTSSKLLDGYSSSSTFSWIFSYNDSFCYAILHYGKEYSKWINQAIPWAYAGISF